MNAIEYYDYKSWNDFKANFILELFNDDIFCEGKYLFRGQRSSDWELISSYDRLGYAHNNLNELIDIFKEECHWLGINKNILSDEKLFTAFSQHHGIPTRLLDWTESPYIAAFFAYADILGEEKMNSKIAIWILNTECGIWTKDYGVEIIKLSNAGNLRAKNQNGCYTLSNTPFKSLEKYVSHLSKEFNGWAIRKCTIPASEFHKVIPDLNSMGINWSKLYPGIQGSVASSLLNWKCDKLKHQRNQT